MNSEQILEQNGWIIECESPFEILHEETGSVATGIAADIILDYYKTEQEDNLL